MLSRSVGLSLYNHSMDKAQQIVTKKLNDLMVEIDLIQEEKKRLESKQQELDIRLHQLVGAVYEVQSILQEISLENQPSASQNSGGRPDDPFETADWTNRQTHPSEGADLNIHQEQPLETEKNSQQPS